MFNNNYYLWLNQCQTRYIWDTSYYAPCDYIGIKDINDNEIGIVFACDDPSRIWGDRSLTTRLSLRASSSKNNPDITTCTLEDDITSSITVGEITVSTASSPDGRSVMFSTSVSNSSDSQITINCFALCKTTDGQSSEGGWVNDPFMFMICDLDEPLVLEAGQSVNVLLTTNEVSIS